VHTVKKNVLVLVSRGKNTLPRMENFAGNIGTLFPPPPEFFLPFSSPGKPWAPRVSLFSFPHAGKAFQSLK
jgi:hypothetical protein